VCRAVLSETRHHCLFVTPLSIHLPRPILFKSENVGRTTELEKSIEEVLKKFMADKAMSEGVQASSTRGLQASPSTGRRSSPCQPRD
jgi:hypothetical protein